MNPKHTKGPWRISGSVQRVQGKDDPLIEHGDPMEERSPLLAQVYNDGGRLPAMANARLIASAPDLYAALARLADRVEQIELQDGSTPDTLEARALLAKIDGPITCRSCNGSGVKTDANGIQSDDVCPDCNGEATE